MTLSLFDTEPAERSSPVNVQGAADITDDCRWTLTRVWRAGPHVCFVGLNPSRADGLHDDPTSTRWTQFAYRWGYGGYTAVNMYPYRSSSPAECRKWADWTNNGPDWYVRDRIHQNVDIVAREAKRAALIVACWGAGAWDNDYVEHVIDTIQSGTAPWPDIYCFGKTASGAPIHPMARGKHRVPDDAQPIVWRSSDSEPVNSPEGGPE